MAMSGDDRRKAAPSSALHSRLGAVAVTVAEWSPPTSAAISPTNEPGVAISAIAIPPRVTDSAP